MRILKFDVKKQRIVKKQGCDFSGLVPGSTGYLKAKFYFSPEWKRCKLKVASFWVDEKEHAAELDEDNSCMIPPEALVGDKFSVSVIGVDPSAKPPYRIGTNQSKVKQGVN